MDSKLSDSPVTSCLCDDLNTDSVNETRFAPMKPQIRIAECFTTYLLGREEEDCIDSLFETVIRLFNNS